ncbi:hypothetical protein Y032_0392g590 [Ancylostoma ceylanicum]|uniref:Nucleoporin Nup133/Nup155-like N-terminal domain-containing protein n=1 Tax=Ancylostoma ceylanicum TaxID=53326 RepID=A0A016RRW2_9BILA|nr:hypothetical protein Y032_0392g590 [Ancylostoma ceylanicum]
MAEVGAMNDLELVLDRMSSEYPALVMETFLSIGMNEISDDSTALADGFCWMVSKHSIFVWSIETEGNYHKGTVQLPLPPSGLPYSAKSVVVYKNSRGRPPGVLVVSGEGVARHFPSLTSSVHNETVIELASEVTLSVQFLESSAKETSFILTTTSGSVFLLNVCNAAHAEIQWARVGSRESRGIGRRLSNIIFGSQATPHDSSRVINSLIYRGDPDGEDCDSAEPIVLTVSPSTISIFDLLNKSASKTINIRAELERRVTNYFERASRGRPVAGLNLWFLDAAKFRSGVLLLLAASHDNITDVTFFLAMTHLNRAQSDVEWLSAIPIGTKYAKNFEANNESSFVGHVFLCVPGQTANSSTCERTDGIIIIYPNFVQSVFLPDRLERRGELLLNKVAPIPTGTKLVGHACDERFCYVMTFDGAISSVRLLPKGFDDDLSNDNAFIEELSNLRDGSSQDDESLSLFVKAFTLFATKNILEACDVMKPLLSKSDSDLTALVYTFLKYVIDQPVGSQPEKGLNKKRIVCNRTILFLNHIGIYDRDFKVLVKVCLELDDEERRARLDAYKRRYVAEEFDMYLCRFLKQKKLNQMLLEEKGERVDRYLLSCEGIRWRRELQNNQFEQSFFAFSKLAAACSENVPEDVVQEASRKLLLLKHQSFIPESLIKTVYPDDPKRPLTTGEMIELNMLDADVVEGHRRALYLLASLLKDGDSSELRSYVANVWISVVKHSDWKQVNQISEIADTPFGGVLKKMVEDENPPDTLVLVLPPCEAVLEACRRVSSAFCNVLRNKISERKANAHWCLAVVRE